MTKKMGGAIKYKYKTKALLPGASATAPVVYQTLREEVEANIGKTEKLSEFLESAGW